MKRKVAFRTLGCRLNQFETDALVTDFHRAGYEVVDFSDKADVYIVNTCTVTNRGSECTGCRNGLHGYQPAGLFRKT